MIRLILIVILLLFALLTVFKAPEYHLWIAAILVGEFSWVFILITSVLLFWGFRVKNLQLAGTITGLIALLLYASPILRAMAISSTLKQKFEAEFGQGSFELRGTANGTPFSLRRMFAGFNDKPVQFQSLMYSPDFDLKLDFYRSQLPGKRPCVVVVHGGSWAGGNSRELPELNSHLAKTGYQVASINYRLAPKYQCPAQVEDVHAAIKYLKAHAEALQIDTDNFVLLGRSAGGQIALLSAYTLHKPGIKAVIGFYAPADMVWGYSIPSNPLIMDSRKVMEDYLGGTYQNVPKNYEASSPLLFVTRQSVPTLLIHGDNDVLVAFEHTRRLNLKLQRYGIRHFVLELPWATHGCDYNLYGPAGQLSTYTIERFLRQVTE